MRYIIPLTQEEREQLQTMLHDSVNHRKRIHAQALLLSHKGYELKINADICQVNRDTIGQWFTGWEKNKLTSLSDATHSGRPSSFDSQEKKFISLCRQSYSTD
ncbi:hypothetical protein OKW21_001496 [Catalinimonas alkaloidigena]|uniref:hypothetical protein n=1 Tax=Catalinimonas alkaloidigena TaxID=1075417 RepID=UPI0024070B31|nr:hypothetical protein [Catalinimonas alkaloidigena]MDF9796233.1 hypothetical protein [Catalinimonas alkaloidigena]